MNLFRLPRLSAQLPHLNCVDGMNQHYDVQKQAVTNGDEKDDFDDKENRDRNFKSNATCEFEAEGTREDVAETVKDAVAFVAQRHGGVAVAIDDELGVFKHFPGTFHRGGNHEAPRHGQTWNQPRQHAIENHSVQHVRKRIRVE